MKYEIRLKKSEVIPVDNSDFKLYTSGWYGDTESETVSIGRSLTEISGTTTFDNVNGWSFNNGYLFSNSGSTGKLNQSISYNFQSGSYYKLSFYVHGIKYPNSGNTLKPYLFGQSGDTIYQNGYYERFFQYAAGEDRIIFEPTSNFAGGVTEIELGGIDSRYFTIYLYEEDGFNLTYQIQNDIASASASYSKTITFPIDDHNAEIINNLFNENVYITENTEVFLSKKNDAGLFAGSLELLPGYLELTRIKNNEGLLECEATFYSNNKNIADKLGDKVIINNENSVDDLDFSGYDHTFNIENILKTHNKTDWVQLKTINPLTGSYTMSDWMGYTGATGVYYPFIDYADVVNGNTLNIEMIKPSIYVKQLFDKIFEKAGFFYNSTFLNSNIFKSLVIPMTNEINLDQYEISPVLFNIGRTTDWSGAIAYGPYGLGNLYIATDSYTPRWSPTQRIELNKDTPAPYFNNGSCFNITNHSYTVTNSGTYTFKGNFWMDFYIASIAGSSFVTASYYTTACGIGNNANNATIQVEISLMRTRSGITSLWGTCDSYMGEIYNGNLIAFPFLLTTGLTTGHSCFNPEVNFEFSDIALEIGDIVYLDIRIKNDVATKNGYGVYQGNTGVWGIIRSSRSSFTNNFESLQNYKVGNKVYVNNILPRSMKQIDFLKHIFNLFNLVVVEDKIYDNTLIIEPFDDFYHLNEQQYDNWTALVDTSKPITIERIPTLLNTSLSLKYKDDDKDTYLKKYKDTYATTYGTKKVINPYLSINEKNIGIEFSPTVLTKFGNTNWPMATIYNDEDKKSAETDNKTIWNSKFNYRILFRSIVTSGSTLSPINLLISGTTNSSTWFGNGTPRNYFPYAGPFDNPYTPNLDLNFGVNQEYYSDLTALPNYNLYRYFWKKKVSMLLDINSKLVTKYLHLNSDKIYNLDFRKPKFIGESKYILNRIIEWNPNDSIKVELYKLNNFELVEEPTYQFDYIPQNNKEVISNVIEFKKPLPYFYYTGEGSSGTTIYDYNNTWPKRSRGIVFGENNRINTNDFFIKGSRNTINSGNNTILNSSDNLVNTENSVIINSNSNTINSNNVFLFGATGNIINSGLTDIILIGVTGHTITTSNTTIISNNNLTDSGTGTSGTSGSSGSSGISGTGGGSSGTSGSSGSSGINGVSANVEDGEAYGQMLYWDNYHGKDVWQHSEVEKLYWDKNYKRLSINNQYPEANLSVKSISDDTILKVTNAYDWDILNVETFGENFINEVVVNQDGSSRVNFRCENDASIYTHEQSLFITDSSQAKVGIGLTSDQPELIAKLHIESTNYSDAGTPALYLNKIDNNNSDPFILFNGTNDSPTSGNILGNKTNGDVVGPRSYEWSFNNMIKVKIKDDEVWIPAFKYIGE